MRYPLFAMQEDVYKRQVLRFLTMWKNEVIAVKILVQRGQDALSVQWIYAVIRHDHYFLPLKDFFYIRSCVFGDMIFNINGITMFPEIYC